MSINLRGSANLPNPCSVLFVGEAPSAACRLSSDGPNGRRETPLLEVLNAQRTYDDLRTAYIETLYDHAAALVELERSAGIWDVVVE